MTPVTIPLSKGKLFLFLALSLGFVAIGVWLWTASSEWTGFKHWKAVIGAVLCVPFFGACALLFAYRLFDPRPGLVLNDTGIYQLGLFAYHPPIHWQHITHCTVVQVKRTSFLLIHVDNVQEVLARYGPVARWFLRVSLGTHGTPHSLSASNLRIGITELKVLIERGVAAHRQRS